MSKCTISGCRNLETICNDCGRVVCTKTFSPPEEKLSPLLERFKKAGLLGCFNDTGVNSENYNEMMEHPLDKIILEMDNLIKTLEFIQNEVSKFQWISVKDQLPEDDETILMVDKELGSAPRVGWYDSKCKGFFTNDLFTTNRLIMTHWMPLPKSPLT